MDEKQKCFLHHVYLETYQDMLRFAESVVSNRDLAQDLVQETFLIAQRKIEELMRSASARAWLFKTLRNVIGNSYQKKRFLTTELLPNSVVDEDSEQVLSVSELYSGIIDAESLTLLIWIFCEGMPYAEAAERLSISLPACRKRIQRAKKALRDAIIKNNLL